MTHSDDFNERHVGEDARDTDDGISLGSILALAVVVVIALVIGWLL